MRPFVPSELEIHLITQHGVDPELIAQSRTLHPSISVEEVAKNSHNLLHKFTLRHQLNHTHETPIVQE